MLRRQPTHKSKTFKHIKKYLPIVIGLICSLGFVAVLISPIKHFLISSTKQGGTTRKVHNNHSNNKENLDIYLNLANHEKSKKFLEEYLACYSVKEAQKFILPDPQINSALVRYWRPRTFEDITFVNGGATILPNNEGFMHVFICQNDDNINYTFPVYHLQSEDRYYIDWRVAEQIEDSTVSEIISKKSTITTKVRCFLVQEDYYNYSYDSKEWLSFNCYDSHNILKKSSCLRVYLRRDSSITKKIQSAFMNQSGLDILAKKLTLNNYSNELTNLKPKTIPELRKKDELVTNKPHAQMVLEINIKNPNIGIAEISGYICSTTVEYFLKYQLPLIKKSRVR